MDNKVPTIEERLTSLETRMSSMEIRLTNIEAGITDLQTGIVNTAVALSTITKTLIDKNVASNDELQKTSETIGQELSEEYKKWVESQTKENKK